MSLIDKAHLDQLMEIGGADLVKELIEIFRKEAPSNISKIKSLDVLKNQKEIGELSHKLKSSCASLGLISMSKHCAMVEKKVRDGFAVNGDELNKMIDFIDKANAELVNYKLNV